MPRQVSRVKRIAIVGLPNSGKSQLCNSLTGTYALVSNYPQTTVAVAAHRITVEGHEWEVTDTPGLHGLFIQSEEELVVRTLLFEHRPDVIVQCVDANRFRDRWGLIHARKMHPSLYDAKTMKPSKLGMDYLLSLIHI